MGSAANYKETTKKGPGVFNAGWAGIAIRVLGIGIVVTGVGYTGFYRLGVVERNAEANRQAVIAAAEATANAIRVLRDTGLDNRRSVQELTRQVRELQQLHRRQ